MYDNVSIPYGKGKVMEHHKNGWTIQYQFPVGKVKKGKVYRKRKGARKAIKVSIPYGKGKECKSIRWSQNQWVSIPYGKGKDMASIARFAENYPLYQFPMGKVKENFSMMGEQTFYVSIPYGKGKVSLLMDEWKWKDSSINSLWER